MTIEQIQERIAPHKHASRATVYRLLKECKIERLGARQKPARYPDTAAARILAHLGIAGQATRIPTLTELRAERKKARAAK